MLDKFFDNGGNCVAMVMAYQGKKNGGGGKFVD